MANKPLITEKEWVIAQFKEIKDSISEIRDILVGVNGQNGITHRVMNNEKALENLKKEVDFKEKRLVKLIIILMTASSFIYIRESRDVIISIVSTAFGL